MKVKYAICIYLYGLTVESVVATDLLDTYHQNDYDLKLERCNVIWFNSSYLRDAKIELLFFNRTQRVFNGTFYLLNDLTKEVTLEMQFYKFMSNEYRYFPISFSMNLCNRYDRNSFGVQEELKNVSNIHRCPLKKGRYYVYNYVFNISKLPPLIPHGSYKGEGKVSHRSDLMMQAEIFASVIEKPFKWNK